jgi:hypothetical protein
MRSIHEFINLKIKVMKKTKQIVYVFGSLLLAGTLMLGGCKKKTKETEDPDDDRTTAEENSVAEGIMSDVAGIGSQGSENGTLSTYKQDMSNTFFMSTCAVITPSNPLNASTNPSRTFTVDFGTTPCICNDGKARAGKLVFDFSGSPASPVYYRTPGFKLVITSQNYSVDGYTITAGTKTITNTTLASNVTPTLVPGTKLTWNISANMTIAKPASGGGGNITWSCNRIKTLENTSTVYTDQSTPINWNNARIKLDGSASGITTKGDGYTANLVGLIRDFGTCGVTQGKKCPFIQGVIEFTPDTKATRYIDFGSGTCDRSATITIKGITYSFNF